MATPSETLTGVASVQSRDGKHRLQWRLGGVRGGPWQSVTFTDPASARRAKAIVEGAAHRITRAQLLDALTPHLENPGLTVAQWCRRHVDSLVVETSTRRTYEGTLRLRIDPTPLGRTPLTQATREDVRRWVKTMRDEGCAPKTIANHHALLAACLAEASRDGLIARNPCDGIALPRRDTHTSAADEMCFLTPQEVALIAGSIAAKYRPVVTLLARTGLRWSELTALQVGDVDLLAKPPTLAVRRAWKTGQEGRVLGVPKTRASRRVIELDRACVDVLAGLVAGRPSSAFVITVDGVHPLTHSTFRRAWVNCLHGVKPRRRKLTQAEIDAMTPAERSRRLGLVGSGLLEKTPTVHDLRHTHASWLLADPRVTPLQVSRRLGHESIKTTFDIYGHVTGASNVLAALDDISTGGAGERGVLEV